MEQCKKKFLNALDGTKDDCLWAGMDDVLPLTMVSEDKVTISFILMIFKHYSVLKERDGLKLFNEVGGRLYMKTYYNAAPSDLLPFLDKISDICKLYDLNSMTDDGVELAQPCDESTPLSLYLNEPVIRIDTEQSGNFNKETAVEFLDLSYVPIASDNSEAIRNSSSPFKFIVFPWQPLTDGDRRIIDSTAISLLSNDSTAVSTTLYFLFSILLRDFSPEILLQRPSVIKAVFSHLHDGESSPSSVLGIAFKCLLLLTDLIHKKVKLFSVGSSDFQVNSSKSNSVESQLTNLSSCYTVVECDGNYVTKKCVSIEDSVPGLILNLSSSTVHEKDDTDEFILLKLHQMTISSYCCQIMQVAVPFVLSPRGSIASACLTLLQKVVNLMVLCADPVDVFSAKGFFSDDIKLLIEEVKETVIKVTASVLNLTSELIKARNGSSNQKEVEDLTHRIRNACLFMSYLFRRLIPLEYSKFVLSEQLAASFHYILCEGGLYLEYPHEYKIILAYFKSCSGDLFEGLTYLLYAADSLKVTAKFLKISSSHFTEFIELAFKSLPCAVIHESNLFIEKIIRGIAKQASLVEVGPDTMAKANQLCINMLTHYSANVRLLSVKAIRRLVMDSIGLSKTNDYMKISRIKFILNTDIIKCLVFQGVGDENQEISSYCQDIMICLLRGHEKMSPEIWNVAKNCWKNSLLLFNTVLGTEDEFSRAVMDTVLFIFEREPSVFTKTQVYKFYISCLYAKDLETRRLAANFIAEKLTENSENLLPYEVDIDLNAIVNMFLVNDQVQLTLLSHIEYERAKLTKVIEMLQTTQLDMDVRRAAWIQLAFFLENPKLHGSFLEIISLPYFVNLLRSMFKANNIEQDISFLPPAVDILLLLATFSEDTRKYFKMEDDILLLVIRASLIHNGNERLRAQASCFCFIIIYQNVLKFESYKSIDKNEKLGVTTPRILDERIIVPFVHGTYDCEGDKSSYSDIQRLMSSLYNKEISLYYWNFLKLVWTHTWCMLHYDILQEYDFSSNFSEKFYISKCEYIILKTYAPDSVVTALHHSLQNCTSHQDVKIVCIALRSFMFSLTFLDNDIWVKYACKEQWKKEFGRFLVFRQNSVDEQLLTYIFGTATTVIKGFDIKKPTLLEIPPLIDFIVTDLTKRNNVFCQVIEATGSVHWVASDPNPKALLAVRLFDECTELLCSLFSLEMFLSKFTVDWKSISFNIISSIIPVLETSDESHCFNLAVLGRGLECLSKVSFIFWPSELDVEAIVISLINLILSLHSGRGNSHNSYMGRSVTLQATLCLISIFSHKTAFASVALIDILLSLNDKNKISTWLESLWTYRDLHVCSAGFHLAALLSLDKECFLLLDSGLEHVTGGIWGISLSYALSPWRSSFERAAAFLCLVNLTSNIQFFCESDPSTLEENNPLRKGGRHDRISKVLSILDSYNIYQEIKEIIMLFNADCPDSVLQKCPSEVSTHLSSFFDFAACENTSSNSTNCDKLCHPVHAPITGELYEVVIHFLVNISLMDPSHVIMQLLNTGTIELVIKKLEYLAVLVTDEAYNKVWFYSLRLLLSVAHFDSVKMSVLAKNTSLPYVILLPVSYGSMDICKALSLELFSFLLVQDGKGITWIMEWINKNPQSFFTSLLECLHNSSPALVCKSTLIFITTLLDTAEDEDCDQDIAYHLMQVLDAEALLFTEIKVCPGWEFCRHAIQLLSDGSSSASLKNKELKSDVKEVINHLEIATSLMDGLPTELEEESAEERLAEIFLPWGHRLWIPALKTSCLMKAVLNFLISATYHYKVCKYTTRTSCLPGGTVSTKKTSKSLLSIISSAVLLSLSSHSSNSPSPSTTLSSSFVVLSMMVLTNCARVSDCMTVISKSGVVQGVVHWLKVRQSFNSEKANLIIPCIKFLCVSTLHHETQMIFVKISEWVNILEDLLLTEQFQEDVLVVLINLSKNRHLVHCLITADGLLKWLVEYTKHCCTSSCSNTLRLILYLFWAICANNQKGKAALKNYPVIHLVVYIKENNNLLEDVCSSLLTVLQS